MTGLHKLREGRGNASGRINIVIVPGNDSETLADQTCPHFPNWLDDIVVSMDKSTSIWIFRHDIRVDSMTSWFAYCEAGEHLLHDLTTMQNDDGMSSDDTLILIGHKLGSFVLKKALLDAHRKSHHPQMDTLLNTIETLVMLGDPDLNSSNMDEWVSLISKCLPSKALPRHFDCAEDARCLQHVAGCFEEFTLHSTLFQVSSAAETKRKRFLKFRAEDHRCIFSASMTIRMWTTTNDEAEVPSGEGDRKNCAFHTKSSLYSRLLSIPDYAAHAPISGTAPLAVLEVQDSEVSCTCSTMGKPEQDLAGNGPAARQATILTRPTTRSTGTIPVTNVEVTSGSDTVSVNSITFETKATDHSYQSSGPEDNHPDSIMTELTSEPEILPSHELSVKPSESTSAEHPRHEGSINNIEQQRTPKNPSLRQPPRLAHRPPFLYMHVPTRDANFFGREELLVSLQTVIAPTSAPPNGYSANVNSPAIIVLHGAPGVGKSAIALELAYRTQARFSHVFWLRANSDLHLAQSFHQAAMSLGLIQDRRDHNHESSRRKFITWLSTTSSKWLLVFDDADELQLLSQFMSRCCRGSIIVTSRQTVRERPDIGGEVGWHAFEVGPFGVKEATEFLSSLARCTADASDPAIDVATMTRIAAICGCLPLTLLRVGMMINQLGLMEDKQLMRVLKKQASRVLAFQPFSPMIYASLSSTSLALVKVIAFLDPYCIDDAILLGGQRYKDVLLSAFPIKDDDYFDAKQELMAHALLAVGAGSNVIRIDRATARSLRAKLDPDDFRDCFQSTCKLLEARWPSRRKMKSIVLGNWPEFDALHSHVHELSGIFANEFRKQENRLAQELFDDTYLKVLFLSTWYNARRGNAEEDLPLIRLAHASIAKSQRLDPRLPQIENSSTKLPARLIDVGLDHNHYRRPRLVDTAGQTGCYVALSHCRRSRSSSELQLTVSNMSRLQQSIESAETPRCVLDAINLTRSLGVRYIWVDSLCEVQDDQDALSRMPEIYRSAVLTIAAVGMDYATADSCIDSSILEQPLSIFLNWSRPTIAKSFADRLFALEVRPVHFVYHRYLKAGVRGIAEATQTNESGTAHEDIPDSDRLHEAISLRNKVGTSDAPFEEASCGIDEGASQFAAGKTFEALALFMKARELVSAFQTLTPRSWKIHAIASANIALVYQIQSLPAVALDIAEAPLAIQSKLPEISNTATFERFRLHFVMGGIHNALKNPDESLKHYNLARQDLETLPTEKTAPPNEKADWAAVLDLKFAQHHLRANNHKQAHALLHQTLTHFQSKQETLSTQAHLARTLHWQSLVYAAQGSKLMSDAIGAAARHAHMGVRKARTAGSSSAVVGMTSTAALSNGDFDAEVEVWFR